MTEAQLNARRENAKHSTGPRTDSGKKRSSLNAVRHGLTGQIIVHTPEDQEAFTKHCDGIRKDLDTVGALETNLAQAIAEDYWRLNRARALENSIFALGQIDHLPEDSDDPDVDAALAQGRTWIAHARELQLLSLYESRIRRSVEKNTAELRALQNKRRLAPIAARLQQDLNARYQGGNDHAAGDLPSENPDSSVRFFEGSDPASDSPEPEGFTEESAAPPPQTSHPTRSASHPTQSGRAHSERVVRVNERTAPGPEPRNNRPEPTRKPTMDDVYDIIGWHPKR
jgi:hypothetical protein